MNYRKSPIAAEDRSPLLQALRPGHHAADAPGLADYLDFGAAPHPGDRVPDVLFETPGEPGPKRLFDVLRDTRHILLLFEGAEQPPHLEAIGALIRSRYADRVVAYLVAHASRPPEGLPGTARLCSTATATLHHRFGARSACLYLIRPDRYIGYRAQPPDAEKLGPAYLRRLFVSSFARSKSPSHAAASP